MQTDTANPAERHDDDYREDDLYDSVLEYVMPHNARYLSFTAFFDRDRTRTRGSAPCRCRRRHYRKLCSWHTGARPVPSWTIALGRQLGPSWNPPCGLPWRGPWLPAFWIRRHRTAPTCCPALSGCRGTSLCQPCRC